MTTSDPPGDKPVGYGSPPRHTQFKKGVSGNPNGRPRGTRSKVSDPKHKAVAELFTEAVSVIEKGRPSKVSLIRVLDITLTSNANKGHAASLKLLLKRMEKDRVQAEEVQAGQSGRLIVQQPFKSDADFEAFYEVKVRQRQERLKAEADEERKSSRERGHLQHQMVCGEAALNASADVGMPSSKTCQASAKSFSALG